MIVEKRPASPAQISVQVLSYHHEQYIERCMLSIASQTYRDFEVVYIDNNSSDQSFERGVAVLEKYNIPFLAEKMDRNGGAASGGNRGLKAHARATYCAPLSADDWWDFDNLSSRLAVMQQDPANGLVYGNGYVYDEVTRDISLYYHEPMMSGDVLREWLTGPNINPQGMLYRLDAIREAGFYDEGSKVEDRELWYRIAAKHKVGYDHNPTSYYRGHASNVSNDLTYMRAGAEYIFQKYEKEYPAEIAVARRRNLEFTAYHMATHNPSLDSLRWMIKHYQRDWAFTKQMAKCVINMVRK